MAEARQAVSNPKLIKGAQTETNYDDEYVLRLVRKPGKKSWKQRLTEYRSQLRIAVYPAHVESFWIVSMLVMAIHFSSRKFPYDFVGIVLSYLPG